MHLKGYEVFVSCDGKPLSEYAAQLEGNDGKTLACFIPSESGKTFAIQWRDHTGQTHLRFVTTLDGRPVGGNRCRPGGKGERWGVRTSATTRKPFQFANLQTTDDDDAFGFGAASHASLGEIHVSVSRIRAEYRSVAHTWGKFRPVGAVHERSKKAGVHCVSLGDNRRATTSTTQTSSTPLNPKEGDVARFVFRYRPLGLLQAQGIVKSVVPDQKIKKRPLDEDEELELLSSSQRSKRTCFDSDVDDFEDDDVKPQIVQLDHSGEKAEDLSRLRGQLHPLQSRVDRVVIKQEGKTSLNYGHVKKEEPKMSSLLRGEVIDLTVDN